MSVEDVQQMSCSELLAQYESVLREIATLSGNGDPNTLNIVDVNAALQSGDYSDVEIQAAFEFNRRDCILPDVGGGGGGSDPTPDMASLCDFTDSDGFVTSVPSSPGGGITQDDITTLLTYQARGDPVPGCASSGGNGDRGGGQAPPPEPEPDRSQLSARLENLSTPGPQEIQVFWSVTNEVTSGTGQQQSGTVAIDLDGRTQQRQSVTISPGGSRSGSVRLADVTPGTREVCVRLQ